MKIHSKDNRHAQNNDADEKPAHHFSFRTPLNFFALFLTAMNCPPFLLRYVEVLVSGFFNCARFLTAPLRSLSPVGLLTAIASSCSPTNIRIT